MMKLTKKQLKELLKECITEMLEEGDFNGVIREAMMPQQNSHTKVSARDFIAASTQEQLQQSRQTYQQPMSEEQDFSVGSFANPNERLRALSRQTAALAGGGDTKQTKMLENIFADTMVTTLREQALDPGANNNGLAGMLGPQEVTREEQEQDMAQLQLLNQMAGGSAGINRWAMAAFNKKK